MSEKDREGQIVLNTLVFARELVEWYQQELDKETKSGKEKEARVQERQAELDGLKTRLEEKDAEREAELARLRLVHEKELGEARASLLEQVRKLQSFGKDLLQKAKAAAEEHQKELAETVSELEAQHRDEMDKLVATHQQEKFAAGKEGQLALSTMQDSHATEMDILRAQQKDKMAQLARVHDRQLATQAQLAQQREAQLHEEKMGKLERMSKTQLATDQHHEAMSSLRSQKGHLRQAVDGDLRRLFQRLQFGIEVVTEPVNLGDMSLPPGSPLDPDGFIKRNGAGALRFLLRHIVWNVIMNGFFSAPFGFGVFGDGEGRDRLFGLYATWRRLVAPSQQSDGAPTPDFEVFFQDPDANRWRSSTFASMRSATANASSQGPDQPLSPYAANIIKVKQDIVELLSAVTAALPEEINHKVDEIVSLAGEMALETGMHESHLGLLMPASGTSTQIGQEFLDCEDEYTVSQTTGNIELGVCPYFYRIGDGTGDFSTTWAIARGKVYIKRSP
ncbi:hypothetical protein QBC36DRAFT_177263 [Triangularia setosa]|uniref:Uncharacterized protein n=1 Tax=Triangularia setosa TaxID=2587417 RepID=A0AAN7A9S8_9PEZI|nr:hypothetical protein QBC36DRAFT_177263 [Podospora setosa]